MIKCIIFDCDGTLVDSEYLCHLGMEIKLRSLGIDEPAQKMMQKFRGYKLSNIISALEEKHRTVFDEVFDRGFESLFEADYRQIVEALFTKSLKATIGIKQTLQQIDQAICVASSGPRNKIELALKLTKLEHFFNKKIFSSYELDSWKPEPDLFLHAAKQMGYSAHECAVVEDSEVGIQAAQAAKMLPILYSPEKRSLTGALTMGHMQELPKIINKANMQ